MKSLLDLARLSEDERIDFIVETVNPGAKFSVIVENIPGKAERYTTKLKAKIPGLIVKQANVTVSPKPQLIALMCELPDCKKN